jgi:hypothetical protein
LENFIFRLSLLQFLLIFNISFAQTDKSESLKKDLQVVAIGFYNVENLYDTINTPGIRDTEFTPEGSNQWNGTKYWEKIDRLAEVIEQMATEITPDGLTILGLAEIENREVIYDLTQNSRIKNRNYKIVHYDSPDRRGVDVGLIYNPKYFQVFNSVSVTFALENDTNFRTRDQLLVSGVLLGDTIHLMVAHWPSRRGGEKKSSHLREKAADVGRSVIDSILALDPNARIMYMGDLNDDPVNVSVYNNLRGKEREKLQVGDLYNPMNKLFKKGIGTLAWRDSWNLFDQIIITQSFLDGDYDGWQYYSTKIFNKPFLRQQTGRFQGYPFRSFAGGKYQGGYSDHFPVYLFLVRNIKN